MIFGMHLMAIAMLLLVLVATTSSAVLSAAVRSPLTTRAPLLPHSVRLEHQLVDLHPDVVLSTHSPAFDWQLADEFSADATPVLLRGLHQTAYRLRVFQAATVLWDSGRVASNRSIQVAYAGPPFTSDTVYSWQLRYESSSGAVSDWARGSFRTALLSPFDWTGHWVGSDQSNMNMLRRVFTLPADVAVAHVFYSGLGYSELWMDGEKVDPSRVLDPGWTTYHKRALYVSFDLTSRMTKGDHAIGVLLGDGWYSRQPQLWSPNLLPPNTTYGPPRLLLQLNAQLKDGSNFTLVSDGSWQGKQSQTVAAGVYQGQIIDKRLERGDWSSPTYHDPRSLWLPVDIMPSPLTSDGELSLQMMDPIRKGDDALHIRTTGMGGGTRLRAARLGVDIRQRVLQPTTESQWGYGALFDLNQNMVGWCAINTSLPRGSSMYIRYSEYRQLKPPPNPFLDGFVNIDSSNYFNIAAEDVYIANGSMHGQVSAAELFEPSFTYRGFRYISVLSNAGLPASSVHCPVVHSEGSLVGNFSSDNDVFSQIQRNILWSQIGNTMSLMTDCPQRNERRGWLGDASGSADLSMFMFDFANLYRNFLQLIHDEQDKRGWVPVMVPYSSQLEALVDSDPSWSTAYTTIAWNLYDHYGDEATLALHYDGLEALFLFVYNGWYQQHGLKDLPGLFFDWFAQTEGATSGGLVSSYSWMHDLYHLVQISAVLNKTDKAAQYNATYLQLAAEFHSSFYNKSTGGYDSNSQTANALALGLPLVVPDALRARVAANLAADVKSRGHLTAGIIGTQQLFFMLSENGYHDVAVALASSTKYPGWGYTFTNQYENCTTIPENFDVPMNPAFASHNRPHTPHLLIQPTSHSARDSLPLPCH